MLSIFPSKLQFFLIDAILEIFKESGLLHQLFTVLECFVEITLTFFLVFHHARNVQLREPLNQLHLVVDQHRQILVLSWFKGHLELSF
jgi:hypothetical protein